jgi:hypothetical protein
LYGDADIRVSRHHSGIANRLISSQVYKVGYKEGQLKTNEKNCYAGYPKPDWATW